MRTFLVSHLALPLFFAPRVLSTKQSVFARYHFRGLLFDPIQNQLLILKIQWLLVICPSY